MDFIAACRKFIAIDSSPHCGTLELARLAAELCREAGLRVELELETLGGVEQANLIARYGESIPSAEFLLQTHLDTVDPGPYALWTKTGSNPFNASIYQDSLFGLGSADSKLDFLCKLKAIADLGRREWKFPFVLAGTFGEEQGMVGAVRLIRKKRIAATSALIGEPTGLRLMSAGKGMAGVEIEIPFSVEELDYRAKHDLSEATSTQSRLFVGKAAHSSAPHLGDSALLKMFTYLQKLPSGVVIMEIDGGTSFNTIPARAVLEIDLAASVADSIGAKIARTLRAVAQVEREFDKYPSPEFVPAAPTLNIGTIRTRADHVQMLGCCRLPPSVAQSVYERWMESLKKECAAVGATFRVVDYKRAFRTPDSSPLVQACVAELSQMGRDTACGAQAATTEANVFSRFGVECVSIGPGQSVGNSHAPDEHVKISELHDAARFYQGIIERICL